MIIKATNEKIRYTGRWRLDEASATSTANGSYFEFMYYGDCAVMCFDTSQLKMPFPHIYISVDNGAYIEASLDSFIRISADMGEHSVCVIMKGSVESYERWNAVIESKVTLLKIEAEKFLDLPQDNRPVIEFIGDSITEGISIDVGYVNYGGNKDMVYWDDSTATYAWLTAKALDLRPVIMGYGGLGTINTGCGNVPPVCESYKYYSNGNPMESTNAGFIVINHGTNDRRGDKELFKKRYFELLYTVRQRNKNAKIISLTPFSGCLAKEIGKAVESFNAQYSDNVFYIDSTGWISAEPIHPLRDGHRAVSEKLTEIIKQIIL